MSKENKTLDITQNGNDFIADVSGSFPIAVASIRSNFELWRKGELKDGAFAWHLQNNLLRIEKELAGNDH